MYKVLASVRVTFDGIDNDGFSVEKASHEMLFDGSDGMFNSESDVIKKGLKGLRNFSRTVTMTLHVGDNFKDFESYRYTYEGYNGKEWMKRKLENGCYEVTDVFVKTSEIKKQYEQFLIMANTIKAVAEAE